MTGPACRISLQDLITEISGSILGAAARVQAENGGNPPCDLALVRVRVRFTARMEYRRRWLRPRGRAPGIVLNFQPEATANVTGELHFDGGGSLVEPPAADRMGDDSNGIQ